MPDLLELAKEAFEKARLFGGAAAQDFGQQHQQNQAERQTFEGALLQGLMNPMTGGTAMPSVEQAISSGLGAAGMAGGREAGLATELPGGMGELSLGPREGLGLLAGMAMPGGPGGKAEGIAAKASQNIAKSLRSKMGPGAQRLAAKAELQPRLAAPGTQGSPGLGRLGVNRANELAEPKPEILDDLFGPEDASLQPELGYSRTANKLSIRPGGPEPQIPPATPINQFPPEQSIELAKKKLAEKRYNLGTTKDVVTLGDEGPAMPAERMIPEYGEEPDFPLLQNNKGSRVRDTNQREMELSLATPDEEGKLSRWGPTRFNEDTEAAGIPGMEAEIGEPRRGSTYASGLEGARYERIKNARAQQIYDEELAKVGGDPMQHTAFKDYIDNMIYSTQNRKDKHGKDILPLDPIPALFKRVAAENEKGWAGKGTGWRPKQQRESGKPQKVPYTREEGGKPLPEGVEGPVREGWERKPENADWLRREALAILTENTRDNRWANRTPEYIADRLLRDHAENIANAAHPDNPESVSTKSHKKPSKFGHANADEGASEDVEDLTQVVLGSGDTARLSQEDLDVAGVRSNMDAFDSEVEDIDLTDAARRKNRELANAARRPAPTPLSTDPKVVAEREAGPKRGVKSPDKDKRPKTLAEMDAFVSEFMDRTQAPQMHGPAQPAENKYGRARRAEPNDWFRIQGKGAEPGQFDAANRLPLRELMKIMGLA